MPLPLQKKRELLFLTLYAMTYSPSLSEEEDPLSELLMETLQTTKKNCKEVLHEAKKILPHINEFDVAIAARSKEFALDRIPHVEKTILRLAMYERSSLPLQICIAEALRLTKKFASPEAISFVNALLDAIFKEIKEK